MYAYEECIPFAIRFEVIVQTKASSELIDFLIILLHNSIFLS